MKLADNIEVKRRKYNGDGEVLTSELSMADECDLECKPLNIKRSSSLEEFFCWESSNACGNDLRIKNLREMEMQNSDNGKETSSTFLCNPDCLSDVGNGSAELKRDEICANTLTATGSEMTLKCRSDDSASSLASTDWAPCSTSEGSHMYNIERRNNVDFSNIVSTDFRTDCGNATDVEISSENSGPVRLHISNIPFRFRENELRSLLEVSTARFLTTGRIKR